MRPLVLSIACLLIPTLGCGSPQQDHDAAVRAAHAAAGSMHRIGTVASAKDSGGFGMPGEPDLLGHGVATCIVADDDCGLDGSECAPGELTPGEEDGHSAPGAPTPPLASSTRVAERKPSGRSANESGVAEQSLSWSAHCEGAMSQRECRDLCGAQDMRWARSAGQGGTCYLFKRSSGGVSTIGSSLEVVCGCMCGDRPVPRN